MFLNLTSPLNSFDGSDIRNQINNVNIELIKISNRLRANTLSIKVKKPSS